MKGSRSFCRIAALLSLIACIMLFAPIVACAAPAAKAAPAKAAVAKEDASAPKAAALLPEDCAKCHPVPPSDIESAGGKHKSDVTCLDCHPGHRPTSRNNIPKCSNCHEGKPHFELKNCMECHKNPHKPLNIVLGPKVTDPCLTCHTDQIKQLRENKSKHSALFCSNCHDVHRKIPQCVKCHKPHSAEMTQADCKKCHKAHKPKVVTYAQDVPNKDCGACHKPALTMLNATPTRHKAVPCVKCHKDKHKMIPVCTQCHTKLHPAAILKKFPKCSICHSIAHDLNNWPASREGSGAAKPAKEHKKK
jgi:hypothetical protein